MASHLFYYFGDDEAYYRALVGEFRKHTRLAVTFKRFFEKDEKLIQNFFLKIYRERPSCIFIDFSKNTQDYMHLARVIARTRIEHKPLTVGLVDYLSPPEVLLESNVTGVNLTHIKSAEVFDVIFDVTKLISPNEIGDHGFARGRTKEEIEAGIPAKIGFIHKEGLHFETDFQLKAGSRIRLNHHWTKERIVPSKEVFVKEVTTSNLFYHFKYAVDVEFIFVDEFLPPEGMDPELVKEKRTEREDLILYYKKQLSRWIDDNTSRSLEKKAKVLIIDRDFHFYDNQPRTDKHAYTIRCLSNLIDPSSELYSMRPQVIAFALDKPDVLDPLNTEEELSRLIKSIKLKFQDLNPFVVVFNCETSSSRLQEKFQYPHIMASDRDLSVDIMVRMADIYEKKIAENHSFDSKGKVFLKKTNSASITEIITSITILKISETDILFQCEHELSPGMNLHLQAPVDMYIHVQPSKSQGKVPEYVGLIHCLGEEEKTELRRYVNSIFFRDHDAQVHAETEEFQKLNQRKLQEKQELIKQELSPSEEAEIKDEENKTNEPTKS